MPDKKKNNDASLVMLGIQLPEAADAERFQAETEQTLEGLPTTLVTCSSDEADLYQ